MEGGCRRRPIKFSSSQRAPPTLPTTSSSTAPSLLASNNPCPPPHHHTTDHNRPQQADCVAPGLHPRGVGRRGGFRRKPQRGAPTAAISHALPVPSTVHHLRRPPSTSFTFSTATSILSDYDIRPILLHSFFLYYVTMGSYRCMFIVRPSPTTDSTTAIHLHRTTKKAAHRDIIDSVRFPTLFSYRLPPILAQTVPTPQ